MFVKFTDGTYCTEQTEEFGSAIAADVVVGFIMPGVDEPGGWGMAIGKFWTGREWRFGIVLGSIACSLTRCLASGDKWYKADLVKHVCT